MGQMLETLWESVGTMCIGRWGPGVSRRGGGGGGGEFSLFFLRSYFIIHLSFYEFKQNCVAVNISVLVLSLWSDS